MRNLILIFCSIIIFGSATFSQTSADYNKNELYIGFNDTEQDTGKNVDHDTSSGNSFKETISYRSFNVSGVRNFNRYFGIKGDISGAHNRSSSGGTERVGEYFIITPSTQKSKSSIYNFLGGFQLKDNAAKKIVKPVGYLLVGMGRESEKSTYLPCTDSIICQPVDFKAVNKGVAAAVGGALDFRINDRVDFRAVKIDYNPIKYDYGTRHNVRIGFGFVLK